MCSDRVFDSTQIDADAIVKRTTDSPGLACSLLPGGTARTWPGSIVCCQASSCDSAARSTSWLGEGLHSSTRHRHEGGSEVGRDQIVALLWRSAVRNLQVTVERLDVAISKPWQSSLVMTCESSPVVRSDSQVSNPKTGHSRTAQPYAFQSYCQ